MTKTYKVVCTNVRTGQEYSSEGTLAELINSHSYTLECGASYQHERGNAKINRFPTSISGLVTNLNKAVNNSAANGYAGKHYTYFETVLA